MVRAMLSTEKDFQLFFSKSVVAVGWSKVDFTAFKNSQELALKVTDVYYKGTQIAAPSLGKKVNEAKRFFDIKEGDFIIVPYHESICLAVAKAKRFYDKNIAGTLDLSNQLEVEYQKTKGQPRVISRNSLREGLQRRLRVRGSTVSNLYEFSDEIEDLFNKTDVSIESKVEKKEDQIRVDFTKRLLTNIQKGDTYLQTGGIGLENLVKELLECEGYKDVAVLSKKAFKGFADADICATKSDRITEHKLLIQVKHHSGFTDGWGLKQLKLIKEQPEYRDYDMALLTSANFQDSLKKECYEANVIPIDGAELAKWIMECASKLSAGTRGKLGISSVPFVNEKL
jgi:hypothetical protein